MYIYIHTLYTYIGWSENMVPLNPLVKHNFLYQNGDFLGIRVRLILRHGHTAAVLCQGFYV